MSDRGSMVQRDRDAAIEERVRCHFNLKHGSHRIVDEVGVDAEDLPTARRDARIAIREMLMSHEHGAAFWSGWTMEVTDDAGAILFVLDVATSGAVMDGR